VLYVFYIDLFQIVILIEQMVDDDFNHKSRFDSNPKYIAQKPNTPTIENVVILTNGGGFGDL